MTINSVGNAWMTGVSADASISGKRSQSSGDSLGPAIYSESFILPTRQNAQKLMTELAKNVKSALQKAGIPTTPSFGMSVDPSNGHISVSGNRSDTKQIENLLNGDPGLAEEIRTTNGICSQVPAIERSLQFEMEYMASSNPQAVVAKYSDLFGPQTSSSSYSLRFTGSAVQALADGSVDI